MRLQHEQAIEQARQQLETEKMQALQQVEQIKLQAQAQIEQFKADNAREIEQMKQQAETDRQAYKAQLDAQTRLQIAQMQSAVQMASAQKIDTIDNTLATVQEKSAEDINQAINQIGTMAQALLATAGEMNKPKKRVIQRDETGRAVAAIEVSNE